MPLGIASGPAVGAQYSIPVLSVVIAVVEAMVIPIGELERNIDEEVIAPDSMLLLLETVSAILRVADTVKGATEETEQADELSLLWILFHGNI